MATIPSSLATPAYIPYAWNGTAPEVHMKPVNAVYGGFNIDQPATAVCPSWDTDCASKNTTIITGPANQTFFMGTLAGSQMMWTDGTASLDITTHGVILKSTTDAAVAPFEVELDDFSNQTFLRFNGNDFVACSVAPDTVAYYTQSVLKVFALSYGSIAYAKQIGPCYPFKMMLVETDAPAVDNYAASTMKSPLPPKWLMNPSSTGKLEWYAKSK